MTNLDSILKSRDIALSTKVHLVKLYFSSGHEWMWELDYKESWGPKNDAFEQWCWRLLRFPSTIGRSNQSILKEISPVFIGRTDVEAETPILWPPDAKSWLFGKDPDAGKDWWQEEKGMTEDEMVGWHHRVNGHGFRVDSRSWWWTGRPGVLWFMGLQKVGHDWATELTDWLILKVTIKVPQKNCKYNIGHHLLCHLGFICRFKISSEVHLWGRDCGI